MNALRKRTDGYALLYVLLVVLVLCAVSMGICTVVLRSYQGQVRSVEQTRQLYQAEGEVEKFAALAADVSGLGEKRSSEKDSSEAAEAEAKRLCWEAYRTALEGYLAALDSASGSHTFAQGPDGELDTSAPDRTAFALTYRNEDVEVRAQVRMDLAYQIVDRKTIPKYSNGQTTGYTYTCTAKIASASAVYLAYEISRDFTEGEDGP